MFLYYILFKLLDVKHGIPISRKNVNCNSLGLALAIDPLHQGGKLVHHNFQTLYYISHKIKYVGPLKVAALARDIMLRTLPAK